ncbi:hypothetical protein F5Y16DRAFT_398912 [Xylariaceae sp. FL0255]|nr:hypothetical protein F5Y16DRAFT_398912 [Xylariaceae sp. FL0255]
MSSEEPISAVDKPTDHTPHFREPTPTAPASFHQNGNSKEPATIVVNRELASMDAHTQNYPNGYHFPPKYPLKEQLQIYLIEFWDFYNTGFGFFLTLYSLLIVGWGGMLFLLLVYAAPEMCWVNGKFDCDDINAPRRIWVEIGSQVLNGLFSVTGFGLAPWRIRDLYLLLRYRFMKDRRAFRKLAGIHRSWLRLPRSDELPPTLGPMNIEETAIPYNTDSVPYPVDRISDPPPTGVRAPPTKLWKVEWVVWFFIWNTILQGFLSGFMWALSRYNRPPWSTGLFVGLALIASSAGGIMQGSEASHVKVVEGVPLTKRDKERLARDKQLGIIHYNNAKDKNPEEEKSKKSNRSIRRRKHETSEIELAV